MLSSHAGSWSPAFFSSRPSSKRKRRYTHKFRQRPSCFQAEHSAHHQGPQGVLIRAKANPISPPRRSHLNARGLLQEKKSCLRIALRVWEVSATQRNQSDIQKPSTAAPTCPRRFRISKHEAPRYDIHSQVAWIDQQCHRGTATNSATAADSCNS